MKRYLWSYTIPDLNESQLIEWKVQVVEKLGITDIFLSMGRNFEPDESNYHRLQNIIHLMFPLRVHAMVFQSHSYLSDISEKEQQIKSVIRKLGNYNVEKREHKLAGIHIDIEPHATDEFKLYKNDDESKVRQLFQNYRYLLYLIKTQINKTEGLSDHDTIFSAATGWWYENRNFASIRYLGQYLDAIVPMAYNTAEEPVGGNFDRLKSKLPFDLWKQRSPGSSGVIVGLGIYEYASYAQLMETVEALEDFLGSELDDNFKGVAFYSDKDIDI